MAAMSLQGLLITWMLVGVLGEPASVYGESRALIQVVPMIIYLIGGIMGDRMDARRLLFYLTLVTAAFPILLSWGLVNLSTWMVIAFGAGISFLGSLADPAKQGIINRITRLDVQRTIAIVTVVPSLVSIAGMSLGTQIEAFGLRPVLYGLAAFYGLAALAFLGLPKLPPITRTREKLIEGFREAMSVPLIRRLIGMNFISAIFNAGGYMVVMPYVLQAHYSGGLLPVDDASLFTWMFIAFTIGSTGSTIWLFFVMPLRQPGRIFLALQLFRIAVIVAIWIQPSVWFFFFFIMLWGVNMGITSTLVRSTIQELAPASKRSLILGFFLFSFTLSSLIAYPLLGHLVELLGPLNALLPGIAISLGLYIYGRYFSGYWDYESASIETGQKIEA